MGLTIENVVEVFLKCSLLSFQLFGETLSVKPPLFFMPLVVGLKKLIWVIHRRHRPLLHWRIPIATHGMVHGRSNTKGIWGPHHLALIREVCRRGWGHVNFSVPMRLSENRLKTDLFSFLFVYIFWAIIFNGMFENREKTKHIFFDNPMQN